MAVRAAPILLALMAAACSAGPQGRPRDQRPVALSANPSAVVAADLALARTAQEQGQWGGMAQFAAPDAMLYGPEQVNALQWLKGRASPAPPVRWQPHQVWSSCDGTLAATHGARQGAGGAMGQYLTIWQRQRDGGYKWVADLAGPVSQPLARPEMVPATVADCATPRAKPDNSLSWQVGPSEDGGRAVELYLLQGGERRTVLHFTARDLAR